MRWEQIAILTHKLLKTNKKENNHSTNQILTTLPSLQCPSRNQEVVFYVVPVHDAEEAVEEREDDQLPVEQLVDAALPAQQQVEEGP